MDKFDIDWVYVGGSLMVAIVLYCVPLLVLAGMKFDERFGEKIDGYLLRLDYYLTKKLRKFEQRTTKKTR